MNSTAKTSTDLHIPATGEREAELREAAQNFATDLYAEHTTISFVRLRETFILAVAPLLDRREGELSQQWRLSSVCREKEKELAALRTLVAKKDEALRTASSTLFSNLDPQGYPLTVRAIEEALALTPASISLSDVSQKK